ncbi:UNVERIFIED_CONTAM: hypothetical protein Sindi_1312900 [Sesamum indicum]
MEHSKRGFLPMRHEIKISKKQPSKTDVEFKRMSDIPYASAVGSIQYVVQCTRPDITGEFKLEGYSNASFQSDDDDAKTQSYFGFKLNGGVVGCKSSKQNTKADSNPNAEYIGASKQLR